jgi:dihydroxyacetone kinase-like protein
MMTKQQILHWLREFAATLEQHKDYLTELDSAIGDADHGINMARGFKAVMNQLNQSSNIAEQDIGSILKQVSMTLISSIGGASGPLYGTFFLRAGATAAGKQNLTDDELAAMLHQGVDGIIQRGKAQRGDKTMLDTWLPALDALKDGLEEGGSVIEAMRQAVAAAEQGMTDTVPMLAKKGRASYLGDRSIGHQDPGATSSYLMLTTLLFAIERFD